MGVIELGLGSLKGLRGSEIVSLKTCFNLSDIQRWVNSLRILLGEGGGDGGMYIRPRISNCTSFSVRLRLERLWIILRITCVLVRGFQKRGTRFQNRLMRTRMEEGDFMEMMERIVVDCRRAKMKVCMAQQAIECVVDRFDRFNGDRVPFFLASYNVEMMMKNMDGALRLEYLCQVTRGTEEALLEAYGYKRPKGRGRREFGQWVTLAKIHRGATQAFLEFE